MAENATGVSPRDYKSKELQWDKLAAIRSKPRRVLPEGEVVGHLFPSGRHPLCNHPLMQELGAEKLRLFLLQHAYKFLTDVAVVETEAVNEVSLKISNNATPVSFPDDIRHDAFSVIVDEAYHAYAARDFMRQILQRTKVPPLPWRTEADLSRSMALGKQRLPEEFHPEFEIVAVCIGENTLTKELLHLTSEKSVNEVLHQVMEDHVRDEGRHSVLFCNVLRLVWAEMGEPARLAIGQFLPEFVREYLNPSQQAKYDRVVLEWLEVPTEKIDQMLAETYVEPPPEEFRKRNPVAGYVVHILKQCGVLAHEPTAEAFRRARLLD